MLTMGSIEKKTNESRKGALCPAGSLLATARRRRRSVEDRRIDALLEQTSGRAKIAGDNVYFLACHLWKPRGCGKPFYSIPISREVR
jgi:hypothetical protein